MILLTRLNGDEFVLNAELIRYVERCPDTLITLVNGETLMVFEPLDEVVRRCVAYHQSKNLIPRIQESGDRRQNEPQTLRVCSSTPDS